MLEAVLSSRGAGFFPVPRRRDTRWIRARFILELAEARASERNQLAPLGLMAPPPGQGQGSAWMQLVPLVFFFVVIYFLLIRPARRKQKQVQQMIEALKPGDRVVTSGGIIGTILAMDRMIVQIRIADKVKVDVTKSSIVGLHERESSTTGPAT